MSAATGVPQQGGSRAARMRAEFDASFATVPAQLETDLTDVLQLRIGEAPCLLRLDEITEVIAHPVFTQVPGPAAALLGLTTGRGAPVAAYDLGQLLGQAPVVPGWLLLLAAEPGVGLAFEHFDGFHRVALGSGRSHRLIEVPVLVDTIRQLSHGSRNTHLEMDS